MGYFSEIVSEARSSGPNVLARPAAVEIPEQQHVLSQGIPSDPAPAAPEPAPVPAPAPEQQPPPAEPAPSAHTPPPPEIKLSVAQDAPKAPDDTAARQAHEAAEAKRKAEWDAKQAEKKAKRQAALDRIKAMNDAELLEAAMGRVAADMEKLTRRNMREAVAAHISSKCQGDSAFAMLVMDPAKSMVNCFRYISRKAYEYVQDELKANGIRPGPGSEGYGCDVPDDLCYQWAVDYFNDPDAKEDRKDDDEQFVPKPYTPSASAPRKKAQGKADKKPPKPKSEADAGQITFGSFASMEAKAG